MGVFICKQFWIYRNQTRQAIFVENWAQQHMPCSVTLWICDSLEWISTRNCGKLRVETKRQECNGPINRCCLTISSCNVDRGNCVARCIIAKQRDETGRRLNVATRRARWCGRTMDARVYRKPSQQHPIERATLFIHYLVLLAEVIVANRCCLVAVAKYRVFAVRVHSERLRYAVRFRQPSTIWLY